jgi:LEA14-like dessication related protein
MTTMLWMTLLGCAKLGSIGDVLDTRKPTVQFNKLRTDSISFDGIEATLIFDVDNPNPVQLALASLDYALDIEGQSVLSGEQAEGFTLPAQDSAKLRVPLALSFDDISGLLDATKGRDELGFSVSGDMGFDTPVGAIKLPYSAEGDIPVLRPPQVRFNKLRVEQLSIVQNKATLALDLDVTNRGGASVTLSDVDFGLALAGSDVASGVVSRLGSIGSDQTETVTVPIDLSLTGLGSAIITALTDRSSLSAAFSADLSVATPYGDIPLHVDESGRLQLQ